MQYITGCTNAFKLIVYYQNISGVILNKIFASLYPKWVLSFFLLIFTFPLIAAPGQFDEAKLLSKTKVYLDQNNQGEGTLYCGCKWEWAGKSGGVVDLNSCGYQVRKQQNRAMRIEWEHIVPAWVFGHQRQCWQNGGRKNCVSTDPIFRKMEADMHNLAPSIGEVNGDRSNFSYAQLPSNAQYPYGQCRSRVDFKQRVFEPRDEVKGQVARVYFYMHDRYNLSMSRQQQQLLMAWDRQYPPSQWEKQRDERIAAIMGHHNPFVTGEMKWELGHKNSAQGIKQVDKLSPAPTKETPKPQASETSTQVKGNRNSHKYHLAHCSGFKTTSDKNAVMFSDELAAQAAGYELAGNCKP
ncbi:MULTISPECIES: endonuclease [Providencia]|uniref:Nuclease, EndA/NucM family n=2 Tax=Gammaproteobacteria TaxID=1236 RepID=A0AA87CSY6_PROST|nr:MULTISPECIES: endonuclease [Providencia]EDU59175.1 nuclease, EndA/NucM family [Providencia stuartii ATCC 25827]EMF0918741.1 endonuclease [Providencia stuartii]MCR4079656.1 endonuclease [Providencia stuartii]MTC81785.1 deoxyribonuclease I [Providencia stuartii]MTC94421.1 deoxyribonuclease I [Providencia stuartii]